jgi:hypothetical protein
VTIRPQHIADARQGSYHGRVFRMRGNPDEHLISKPIASVGS